MDCILFGLLVVDDGWCVSVLVVTVNEWIVFVNEGFAKVKGWVKNVLKLVLGVAVRKLARWLQWRKGVVQEGDGCSCS
ncbi:hypothetical protein V6N13_125016 [Hibiscus sabdariffa]|uniref:Transmembrane protein n=1 Tax=Hibiscus sabdariffa TaxID=183260 RepID=A0ABR2U5C0_9ROSI